MARKNPTNDIMLMLGEMKGDIKSLLDGQRTQNGRLADHDTQLRFLKTWQDTATGKFAVLSTVFAFFVTLIGAWINHKFFR